MTLLTRLHTNARLQLVMGLLIGIAFGFLLQKSGVTDYNVILGQLLLQDMTFSKLMVSAIIVAMPGVYLLVHFGCAQMHVKPGTLGSVVVGGLIFGTGFALLGYGPETVAGAAGTGALDALCGGIIGMILGSGLFAALYPKIKTRFLNRGPFPAQTLPELLNMNPWVAIGIAEFVLIGILILL
ncbi:MAG: YeeE/YedE thiosulfate transporter family protein [Methanoregula sp.]|jgi:hypothetical protein|uniref:YeeE/YedE thiosulfate transporter family protein n=1 Tax=Methanoregula sp. TaxID=2052170 RepID=UPI003C714475